MVNIGGIEGLLKLRDEFTTVLDRAVLRVNEAGHKMEAVGQRLSTVGSRLTYSLTLPLAAAGAGAVRAATQFESSFAGIRKTVNATEEEFSSLAAGMRQMSKEIPINVNELNKIGEAAGQLGIKTQNIAKFTQVVAALGVSTNMTTDAASTALARIANITGLAQTEFDRMGATIVDLGNNFATTEAEIVEFGLRIAGAGEVAGLTEAQILAIGAAVSSVGVEAEAGGTAVQKVLLGMVQAVVEGGKHLDTFARTAGMSAAQFKKAFTEDAGATFKAFVEGLGRQGSAAFKTLDDLGLGNERLTRTFLSLANAGDLLGRTMTTSDRAWQENTALMTEAGRRYETFESKMTLLHNRLNDVAITVGQALVPVLLDLLNAADPLIKWAAEAAKSFSELPKGIRATVLAVGSLAALLGPVLWIVGNLTQALGMLAGGAVAAGGSLTTMGHGAVALRAALGPIGALLTLTAGLLLKVASEIRASVASMQEDIDNMVASTTRAGQAYAALRKIQLSGPGTVLSQSEVDAVKARVAEMSKEIEGYEKKIRELREFEARGAGLPKSQRFDASKQIADLQGKIKATQREIDKYNDGLRVTFVATSGAAEATNRLTGAADELGSTLSKDVQQALDRLTVSIYEEVSANRYMLDLLKAGNLTVEEAENRFAAYKKVVATGIDPTSALGKKMLDLATFAEELADRVDKATEELQFYQDQLKKLDKFIPDIIDRSGDADDIATMLVGDIESMSIYQEWLDDIGKQIDEWGLDQSAADIEAANRESQRLQNTWQDIAELGSGFASALEDSDPALAGLIRSAAALAAAMANVQAAATATEAAIAGMQMGGAIYGIGQSLGLWDSGGGTGSFGAKMSGNYADIGSQVGGAIGAAIGAYFTAGAGTALGGVIGSVLGGIIGSAIKSGADEGIVHLEQIGAHVAQKLIASEGGLGKYATDAGNAIQSGVQAALDMLGGQLAQFPDVGLKIRDDIVSVTVGAVKSKFDALDEAIAFAVTEVLKQGGVTDIAPELMDVLQGFQGSDLGGLTDALDLVQSLMDTAAGFTELQSTMRQLPNSIQALNNHLVDLGLSVADAERLSGAALIDQMNSIRDSITGRQKSNAEIRAEKEREAVMFNAQKALMIAEYQMKKLALQAEVERLSKLAELVKVDANLETAALETRGKLVQLEGDVYEQELRVRSGYVRLSAEMAAAQALLLQQQIAAIDAILASMPKDIDLGEIDISGLTGGGGHGVDMPSAPEEQLPTLEEWQEAIASRVRVGLAAQLHEIEVWAEEQRAIAEKIGGDLSLVTEAEQELLRALTEDVIDSLGLPMESLRDRFDDLTETIAFLQDRVADGTMTVEEFADIMDELGKSATSEMYGLAAEILETMGLDSEAAEFRQMMAEAEFAFKVAEFQAMFLYWQTLGVLSEEVMAKLQKVLGLISDPANWPDFSAPDSKTGISATGGPKDVGGKLGEVADRLKDLADALRDYVDSLIQDESLSPYTVGQRFALAQEEWLYALERINQLPFFSDERADLIEQLPDLADTYLQLAAQMFGTSSPFYQQIFESVVSALSDLATALDEASDNWQDLQQQLGRFEDQFDDMVDYLAYLADQDWGGGGGVGAPDMYIDPVESVQMSAQQRWHDELIAAFNSGSTMVANEVARTGDVTSSELRAIRRALEQPVPPALRRSVSTASRRLTV